MAVRVLGGVVLVILGGALGALVVSMLGAVMLVVEGVHLAWARRGIGDVRYVRRLGAHRTPFGGEIPLEVEVWNRGRLPLAWVRADDETSVGVEVRERETIEDEEHPGGLLRNAWTLRPFERVTRFFHVTADRRGAFSLGPAEVAVADPFAREAAMGVVPAVDRFLVWPRTLPTTEVEPPQRFGTVLRSRAGLVEDPSRFAGTRPYAAGDPMRRVHARTSARVGRPMTKRFEPSREREVLIALDVQTMSGPAWDSGFGDDETVESLYVIAGSVARSLAERRVAFGLVAAGYSGVESVFATVPVSSSPGQAERVLDLLARLSTHASAPFDALLTVAARSVRPGTTVLVLSARDPRPFAGALRRMRRVGADVVILAAGPAAAANLAGARAAGFSARRAGLDGAWRSAGHVVIGP